MTKLLIIGSGGFVGAILRYQVSGWMHRWLGSAFPFGTLAVNVLGSFILGFFLVLANEKFLILDAYRSFLAIGLLGAFTTFSTFSYETMALLQVSMLRPAFFNIGLNVLVALVAVWLGMNLARLI